MATVNEERERLESRLRELDQARATVDAEAALIRYALDVLGRVEIPTTTPKKPRRTGGPSTVDLAVEVIDAAGRRTWRVSDVIEALEHHGWGSGIENKTNAVRTSLGRAVERGLLARHGQGEYVSLAFQEEPEPNMAPVEDNDPWRTPPAAVPSAGWSEEPPF